MDAQG